MRIHTAVAAYRHKPSYETEAAVNSSDGLRYLQRVLLVWAEELMLTVEGKEKQNEKRYWEDGKPRIPASTSALLDCTLAHKAYKIVMAGQRLRNQGDDVVLIPDGASVTFRVDERALDRLALHVQACASRRAKFFKYSDEKGKNETIIRGFESLLDTAAELLGQMDTLAELKSSSRKLLMSARSMSGMELRVLAKSVGRVVGAWKVARRKDSFG